MARPAKPAKVIQMEKRSHRTKQELAARNKAEKSVLSSSKLKERPEVAADPVAHREYRRLKKLFKAIDKDDDLYGDAANTMAMITSELTALEEQQRNLSERMEEISPDDFEDKGEYWKTYTSLQDQYSRMEGRIDRKRKLRLQLEKECCMTIAAALRAIPKQPKETNPLREALYGS